MEMITRDMHFLSAISLHTRLCYLTMKSFISAGLDLQNRDIPSVLVVSELPRLLSSKIWEQLFILLPNIYVFVSACL